MPYPIYQTQAFILRTENSKESNKLVYLYTQKFGFIVAYMQSLRELKSKMRYHIHPFSLVSVDLVSGKNIWRITGAHEIKNSFSLSGTPWFRLFSLFSDTIIRLCGDEEENEYIWQLLFDFLNHSVITFEKHEKEIEIFFLVHLLFALGYWDEKDDIFSFKEYSLEIFSFIKKNKFNYIKKINESLQTSQL